mgnify:CR=1 FL=1
MANENLSFKLVTDNKNTFFTNNKFISAESLPVEGDFIKGDIIVNIGETADTEAMWVCVESGNPGIWEVVGSGVGGGGGGSVSCRKSRTTINGEANEVNIGISGFNKSTDTLLAFANARLIVEGVDYSISNDGKIVSLNGNWNKQAMNEFHFDFIVFEMGVASNGNNNVGRSSSELIGLKNNVTLEEDSNEVEIGIPEFNKNEDMLTVYKNSVYMMEGKDYEFNEAGDRIVAMNGEVFKAGTVFGFVVLKEVPVVEEGEVIDGRVIEDGSIGLDKLDAEVKEAIEAAGNIDMSEYVSEEELEAKGYLTEHQDLSGYVEQDVYDTKIAELEGKVNEAFTNANNGKELIANAIGEPVSADDTFQAMSNSIDNMTIDFRNALALKGVNAPADKFETLINRIDEIVQSGNVINSNQFVSGSQYFDTTTTSPQTLTIDLGRSGAMDFFMVEVGVKSYYSGPYTYDNPLILYSNKTYDTLTSISNNGLNNAPVSSIEKKYSVSFSGNNLIVTSENYGSVSNFYIESVKWYIVYSNSTPNNGGARTITPTTSNQVLPSGYYDGNITVKGDSNLKAENIVSGKSIFGVSGTASSIKYATGSGPMVAVTDGFGIAVSNLDFTPTHVYGYALYKIGSVTNVYVGSLVIVDGNCRAICYGIDSSFSYSGIKTNGFNLPLLKSNLSTVPNCTCYWTAIG